MMNSLKAQSPIRSNAYGSRMLTSEVHFQQLGFVHWKGDIPPIVFLSLYEDVGPKEVRENWMQHFENVSRNKKFKFYLSFQYYGRRIFLFLPPFKIFQLTAK